MLTPQLRLAGFKKTSRTLGDARVQPVLKAGGQRSRGLSLCGPSLSQQEPGRSGHPQKGCNWDQTLGLLHLLTALEQVPL